jgi:hypothetical protein
VETKKRSRLPIIKPQKRPKPREQVKAEEQINYLTKASIGYGIEKRVGKRQK